MLNLNRKGSEVVARVNNYEVWVAVDPRMADFAPGSVCYGVKPLGGSQWVDRSAFEYNDVTRAERDGIQAAKRLPPANLRLSKGCEMSKKILSAGFADAGTKDMEAGPEREVEAKGDESFDEKVSKKMEPPAEKSPVEKLLEVPPPTEAKTLVEEIRKDIELPDHKRMSLRKLGAPGTKYTYKGHTFVVQVYGGGTPRQSFQAFIDGGSVKTRVHGYGVDAIDEARDLIDDFEAV
jgi:hypothetical protein